MVRNPRHHAAEGACGFTGAVDGLLLVVEVGEVDAGCARDQEVYVAGNGGQGSESGVAAYNVSIVSTSEVRKRTLRRLPTRRRLGREGEA